MPTPHTTTDDAMCRHPGLPLLATTIHPRDTEEETPLARQWRILKLLTFSPEGFSVRELASMSGTSLKTIRRDLVFLQDTGFDLTENVGPHGRKRWRIRRLPESMSVRGMVREKYGLIHDTLSDLHDAALIIGDSGLAQALKQLQEWVAGKCGGRKAKPR